MKVMLHTRAPVFDDKGGFKIHEPGDEVDLPKAEAEALIAKGSAVPVEAKASAPPKPAA